MRLLAATLSLTSLFALSSSCETWEPQATDDYVFHDNFEFGAAHENAGCDACHVLAASVMLQQTPDTPNSPWTTFLELDEDNACISCHPFVRSGPDSEEATVDCATIDDTSPYYETERCRYERHPSHGWVAADFPATACTNCHPLSNANWTIGGGGHEPVGSAHDDPPLVDVFPLINGHAGRACGDCHAGDFSAEIGKSASCASAGCHTRADESTSGDAHKPVARAGGADIERDCSTCHADVEVNGDRIWPLSWVDLGGGKFPLQHEFLVDHATVETWRNVAPGSEVLRPQTDWVRDCWRCHNAYPNDAVPPTQIYLTFDFATYPVSYDTCTEQCHQTELTANHGAGQACTEAGCHPTAGPSDWLP